jgi:hypothetical protein
VDICITDAVEVTLEKAAVPIYMPGEAFALYGSPFTLIFPVPVCPVQDKVKTQVTTFPIR